MAIDNFLIKTGNDKIDVMLAEHYNKKKKIRDLGLNNKDPFIRVQTAYIDFIETNLEKLESSDNLNALLTPMSSIEMDSRYVLDDYRSRAINNSILQLYARSKYIPRPTEKEWVIHEYLEQGEGFMNGLGVKVSEYVGTKIDNIVKLLDLRIKERAKFPNEHPILEHLNVPYTRMGMWQAYWIWNSNTIFGMRWHGGYHRSELVYCIEQVKNRMHLKEDELIPPESQIQSIPYDFSPIITLDDIGNCVIRYYSWNNWTGLVRKVVNLTYDFKSNTICEIKTSQEVLVKYSCRIRY